MTTLKRIRKPRLLHISNAVLEEVFELHGEKGLDGRIWLDKNFKGSISKRMANRLADEIRNIGIFVNDD